MNSHILVVVSRAKDILVLNIIVSTDHVQEEEDTTTVLGKKSTYTAPLNLLHETANDKVMLV